MKPDDKGLMSAAFSDRFRRSLINQMAHRLAHVHFSQARAVLQGELDAAEMRGLDARLLHEWQQQLQMNVADRSADAFF